MAGSGVIQAELSIELGKLLAGLNQASSSVAKFAQGAGQGMKPANDAVDGLTKSFKDFKREQVQEGRMVGFYVKELTSFTGASAGVQAGIGGIVQGMIGMATAGGPVMALWAGFELIKGTFELMSDGAKRAAEDMKKFADEAKKAVDAGTAASFALAGGERSKLTDATGGDSRFAAARTEAIGAVKALRTFEMQMGVKGRSPSADLTGIISSEQLAIWTELTKKVKDASAALLEYQRLKPMNEAMAGGMLGPANAKGLSAFESEFAADLDRRMETAGVLAVEAFVKAAKSKNAELTAALVPVPETSKAWNRGLIGGESTEALAAWKLKQPVFDNSKVVEAQIAPMRKYREEIEKLAEVSMAVGDGVTSVFASIGSAIGGAAGQFISTVGQMIAQTIALVLALTFSDTLMTGPLGVFAAIPMAAGILASLIGMIASIPSYDVGSAFVPETGLAMVHRGERIITAQENAAPGSFGGVTVNFHGVVDANAYWRANERHIVRTLREATRGGRA